MLATILLLLTFMFISNLLGFLLCSASALLFLLSMHATGSSQTFVISVAIVLGAVGLWLPAR